RPMTVIGWLLDSDPSIRWQVMRDLMGAPAEEVTAERARVATEGLGVRLLPLQGSVCGISPCLLPSRPRVREDIEDSPASRETPGRLRIDRREAGFSSLQRRSGLRAAG